ncbi:MAG: HDOD domain-containing protein [Desulfobulbaceae bacterium]|nr:HDOD domain-containing protein [Desulfobulbaceae bacterium]MCK5436502.1 HDOD domain-containing protein [Desulfobulbaceae bacterium]MCK5543650.1 HDOD domain-containing protein [Desulfobulbaceae bacterium]
MSRLKEILDSVQQVAPFPKVAMRVIEMLKHDVTAKDLADVIQYDQAITATVLKVCNSSYFALSRKISSLDEALVVIGQNLLKEVIITSSSSTFFRDIAGGGYKFEQGEIWKHSVAVAIMSRQLMHHVKVVDEASAFTVGLLHDIGKQFLSSFVKEDFNKIMRKVLNERCSFVEAEKYFLGTTHAELGGIILMNWEFPEEMVTAVRDHHEPDALDRGVMTALVALSNVLVASMGIGVGAGGLATRIHGEGLRRFDITQNDMDLHMADLLAEMAKAEEILAL